MPCTLHRIPYTLHPTPHTLYLIPYTLRPICCALQPISLTLYQTLCLALEGCLPSWGCPSRASRYRVQGSGIRHKVWGKRNSISNSKPCIRLRGDLSKVHGKYDRCSFQGRATVLTPAQNPNPMYTLHPKAYIQSHKACTLNRGPETQSWFP